MRPFSINEAFFNYSGKSAYLNYCSRFDKQFNSLLPFRCSGGFWNFNFEYKEYLWIIGDKNC